MDLELEVNLGYKVRPSGKKRSEKTKEDSLEFCGDMRSKHNTDL
jgi:hypothetical protein